MNNFQHFTLSTSICDFVFFCIWCLRCYYDIHTFAIFRTFWQPFHRIRIRRRTFLCVIFFFLFSIIDIFYFSFFTRERRRVAQKTALNVCSSSNKLKIHSNSNENVFNMNMRHDKIYSCFLCWINMHDKFCGLGYRFTRIQSFINFSYFHFYTYSHISFVLFSFIFSIR